jgi:hypothetical protein
MAQAAMAVVEEDFGFGCGVLHVVESITRWAGAAALHVLPRQKLLLDRLSRTL